MAITGILDKHTESDDVPTSAPYCAKWISEDLLTETRKVWSKAYGRVLSNEEAIEFLMNVKRMAEVLIEMQRE
jgi:hypothetical protein